MGTLELAHTHENTQENKALHISLVDSWEEEGKVFVKQTTSPDVSAWLPAST